MGPTAETGRKPVLTGLPEDIIIGCLQPCTRKIIPDSFGDSATFYTNVGKVRFL